MRRGLVCMCDHWHDPAEEIAILESEAVHFCVRNFIQTTTSTQQWRNGDSRPLEAKYSFELEKNAALVDLEVEVNGKSFRAAVKEKVAAQNDYDDAIASGGGGYLVEQESVADNTFSFSLGNVPPQGVIKIKLSYMTELATADTHSSVSVTIRTPKGKGAITGDFEMPSRILAISSAANPVVQLNGTKASVHVPSEQTHALSTFVTMSVTMESRFEAFFQVSEVGSDLKAAMLTIVPKLTKPDVPEMNDDLRFEVIFIVDRSGSMGMGSSRDKDGDLSRIDIVRETLQVFLRSLPESVLFNIIGFGSNFLPLFDKSTQYNQASFETASAHIEKMKADMGGTELLKVMQHVFKQLPVDGYPRVLFILTDGEVGNTQECLRAARHQSHSTKIFTFGIGEASPELINGLAEAGHGSADFVGDSSSIQASLSEKVMHQLKQAIIPAITNVTIDWSELESEFTYVTPARHPPVFDGQKICSSALIKGAKDASKLCLKITALSNRGDDFRLSVPVHFDTSPSEKVGTLVAARLLRDIEDGTSFLHQPNGQLVQPWEPETMKQFMIDLSVKSNVVCSHTALVAVEARDEATTGAMNLLTIPIDNRSNALRHPRRRHLGGFRGGRGGGHGGRGGRGGLSTHTSYGGRSVGIPTAFLSNADRSHANERKRRSRSPQQMPQAETYKKSKSHDVLDSDDDDHEVDPSAPASTIIHSPADVAAVQSLIRQQNFDGSAPAKVVSSFLPHVNIQDEAPAELKDYPPAIWTTLLFIAILQTKYANLKTVWELVLEKAKKFVFRQLGQKPEASFGALIEVAEKLVRRTA